MQLPSSLLNPHPDPVRRVSAPNRLERIVECEPVERRGGAQRERKQVRGGAVFDPTCARAQGKEPALDGDVAQLTAPGGGGGPPPPPRHPGARAPPAISSGGAS